MTARHTLTWPEVGKTVNEKVRSTDFKPLLDADLNARQPPGSRPAGSTQFTATSPQDSIELIPAGIPTDINVGKSVSLLDRVASVLGQQQLQKPKRSEVEAFEVERPQSRSPVRPRYKRSASSELLKIDDLDNYMAACNENKRAVDLWWSEAYLLAIIAKWRALDVESKDQQRSQSRPQESRREWTL